MGRPPKKPKLSDEEIAALVGAHRLRAKKRAIGLLKQSLSVQESPDPTLLQDVISAFRLKPAPDGGRAADRDERNAPTKAKTRYYSKKGSTPRSRTAHDEHNEVCEVCDRGGDLLCCETCTLVFHLQCLRPRAACTPRGSWSCPHCVLDGSAAGDRAKAREAVRAMWNLELGLASEDDEPAVPLRRPPGSKHGEDFDPDADLAADVAFREALRARLVGEVTVAQTAARRFVVRRTASDQVLELGRYQSLADALASLPEQSGALDKRAHASSSSKKRAPPSSSGVAATPTGAGAAHAAPPAAYVTPLWCTQCVDSAQVSVCAFCGCTKCGGKGDSELLILCDRCGRVVHTFCHDPPLNAIPSANPWFCEGCRLLPPAALYAPPLGDAADADARHDAARDDDDDGDAAPPLDGDWAAGDGDDALGRRKPRSDSLVSVASTTASGASSEQVKRGRGRPPGSGKRQLLQLGGAAPPLAAGATTAALTHGAATFAGPPPAASLGGGGGFALHMRPVVVVAPPPRDDAAGDQPRRPKRSLSAASLNSGGSGGVDGDGDARPAGDATDGAAAAAAMDVDEPPAAAAPLATSFSRRGGLQLLQALARRPLRSDEAEWLAAWREAAHAADVAEALRSLLPLRDALLAQLRALDASAHGDMLRVFGAPDAARDAQLLAGRSALGGAAAGDALADGTAAYALTAAALARQSRQPRARSSRKPATPGRARAAGPPPFASLSPRATGAASDGDSDAADDDDGDAPPGYALLRRDASLDSSQPSASIFSLSFDESQASDAQPPPPAARASLSRASSLLFGAESPSLQLAPPLAPSATQLSHSSGRTSRSDEMLFALSASPLTTSLLAQQAPTAAANAPPRPASQAPQLAASTGAASSASSSLPSPPRLLSPASAALSSLASSVQIMPSGTIVFTGIPLRHQLQPHQQLQLDHLQQSLAQSVLAAGAPPAAFASPAASAAPLLPPSAAADAADGDAAAARPPL